MESDKWNLKIHSAACWRALLNGDETYLDNKWKRNMKDDWHLNENIIHKDVQKSLLRLQKAT